MASEPLFDTHAHLVSGDWDRYPPQPLSPDLPTPPRPNFTVTVEQLIEMMDRHDVSQSALVQRGHIYGYDNSYILESAELHPDRLYPVVILDALDPAAADQYREMVLHRGARGFRMAVARPWMLDTGWLCSPSALRIWEVCAEYCTPMALILFMNQLPYLLPLVKILAGMFPELPIVLDHGAMPYGMTQYEVAIAEDTGQSTALPPPPHYGIDRTIAIFEDVPNIYFKITEINMERTIKNGVEPAKLVRRMADSFGADRLMWGSDIGQSMLWSYDEKIAMARAAADLLTPAERRDFFHDNGARIYGAAGTTSPEGLKMLNPLAASSIIP